MEDIVLYISFERNNEVKKKIVTIKDIATIFVRDEKVKRQIEDIVLVKITGVKRGRYVISILDVYEKIYEVCPNIRIMNVGETDFIIDYIDEKKPWYKGEIMKYVNITFICLVTLCGSAFTIVAYDNDVDIPGIFEHFYSFFQGGDTGRRIMELAYSLGFGLGIIVFFNHFGGKKLTSDPTPIEVEMSSYEMEIDEAIIDRVREEQRRKKS